MRFILRIFILLTLAVLLNAFLGTGLVLADDPCKIELMPGESIPSTFPVGKCLKLEKQKSYVPDVPVQPAPAPTGEEQPAAPTQTVSTGLVGIFIKATDLFSKIIASLSLLAFIIGALFTVISEGKEDRLEKGKSAMLFSIIGLIIALLAFIIVTFVQSILF